MSAQQTQQTVFKYSTPEAGKAKTIVRLCRSDIMYASVHVLTHGGETNLHAHLAQDGFWMVLKGRARFYGEGNVLIADLGPNEGILVPRGFQYWFESGSSELLELLRTHRDRLSEEMALVSRQSTSTSQAPGRRPVADALLK